MICIQIIQIIACKQSSLSFSLYDPYDASKEDSHKCHLLLQCFQTIFTSYSLYNPYDASKEDPHKCDTSSLQCFQTSHTHLWWRSLKRWARMKDLWHGYWSTSSRYSSDNCHDGNTWPENNAGLCKLLSKQTNVQITL